MDSTLLTVSSSLPSTVASCNSERKPVGPNNKVPSGSTFPNARLFFASLVAAMGGAFNFGYQLLITNPSQEAFIQFVNKSYYEQNHKFLERANLETMWSLIVSLFFWGSTVGAFSIHLISEKLGRKNGLQISHLLQIIICGLTILSYYKTSYIMYSIARFFLGFSISISLGISPIFITECSPNSCRGITSLATGVMLQFALVVGAVVAMPQIWGTENKWWILYAFEMALTTAAMLIMPVFHDSPGYLLTRGKASLCEKALTFYHGLEGKEVKEFMKGMIEDENANKKTFNIITVWKDPVSRRGILVGGVVMLAMVISGVAVINAFAFEIFLSTGLNALQSSIGNIVICAMSAIGIVISSLVVDRYGRRLLLLSTYASLAVINCFIFGFMIGFEKTGEVWMGYSLIGTICLFNLIFAAGPGPVSLFITGELVGQNSRGAASTWVNVVMSGGRSIILATYLPLKNAIGQPFSYLLLFLPLLVVTVVIIFFHLPETRGKSPAEVQQNYKSLPGFRKTRRHQMPIN